jgi:hypothetical protein
MNELEVFAREHPIEFGIRTTPGPTPFVYRYRFASDGAGTVIQLDSCVELTGATAVLGSLAARRVRRGVDANLAAIKHTLETSARYRQPLVPCKCACWFAACWDRSNLQTFVPAFVESRAADQSLTALGDRRRGQSRKWRD